MSDELVEKYYEYKNLVDKMKMKIKKENEKEKKNGNKKKKQMRCPVCNTVGKVIFKREVGENGSIILSATCPNSKCPNNMKIELGYYENSDDLLFSANKRLEKLKLYLQQLKMEHIYGVISDDDLEKDFETLNNDIELTKKILTTVKYQINRKQKIDERMQKISENDEKVERILDDIRGLIRTMAFDTIIDNYQELYKLMEQSRELRYEVMKVVKNPINEMDVTTNKYGEEDPNNLNFTLIRKENTIENTLYNRFETFVEDERETDERETDDSLNNVFKSSSEIDE